LDTHKYNSQKVGGVSKTVKSGGVSYKQTKTWSDT